MFQVKRTLMVLTLFAFSMLISAQSVAAQVSRQTGNGNGNNGNGNGGGNNGNGNGNFTCATGNCVPEAPMAIILPIVAVLVIGIVWFVLARTQRANQMPEAR